MTALTVVPHQAGSLRLDEIDEPSGDDGAVLVDALLIGVCGTDREIIGGTYGWAPPGRRRLVIGHESLGRVIEAPTESGLKPGDLVAGIVRHPDPLPCASCAAGEWDFCRNGGYSERGIKERDGFCAQRFRLDPGHAVAIAPTLGHLGVLTEPASVVAKAWEQIETIASRSRAAPERVVVTGAGPIGLLMALLASQHDCEVHVVDRVTNGPKPQIVDALGAGYHSGEIADACDRPDVVFECTGDPTLVLKAAEAVNTTGIVCCLGRSIDIGMATVGRSVLLENRVIVGTVNANRRHYERASDALSQADPDWLRLLISRTVSLDRFDEAFEHRPDDIKVVLKVSSDN